MSIKFIKQDLTTSDADYICHQVNCQGKMNSGVAKAIREKWPIVYDFYQEICRQNINEGNNKIDLLGKIAPINVDHYVLETYLTPPTVINMFAQNGYGYDGKRYTSYDAFWSCLGHIKETVPKGSKIAFPYKIGCDRGGATWEVIFMMIVTTLGEDYDIEFCYLEEDLWLKLKNNINNFENEFLNGKWKIIKQEDK